MVNLENVGLEISGRIFPFMLVGDFLPRARPVRHVAAICPKDGDRSGLGLAFAQTRAVGVYCGPLRI
jgi:hypothetical protein